MPYYELRQMLLSGNIGSTNYSRYKSDTTDALFNSSPRQARPTSSTSFTRSQRSWLNDVPVIPVIEGVDWYQYDTTDDRRLADPRRPVRPAAGLGTTRTMASS